MTTLVIYMYNKAVELGVLFLVYFAIKISVRNPIQIRAANLVSFE